MVQYEKITDYEGIDHNKNSNTARFFDVCKFLFFFVNNFSYEDYACNECHNLLMTAFSLHNNAVLNVGNVFYRCNLMGISKGEGLKRLNNANKMGKGGIV